MKKLLLTIAAALFSLGAQAANCDLVIRQLDMFGSEVPRLVMVPSGCAGASGVLIYDAFSTQPQIVAGTSGQYIRGDGSVATFPTIPTVPTINRAVITTAADGTYTWNLPNACGVGQLPVVSVTPQGVGTDVYNHKVTASTNSSVTIAVARSQVTVVALLGLTILSVPASVGATTVHMIAVCP